MRKEVQSLKTTLADQGKRFTWVSSSVSIGVPRKSLLQSRNAIALTKTPQYNFSQSLKGPFSPLICRFSQGSIHLVAAHHSHRISKENDQFLHKYQIEGILKYSCQRLDKNISVHTSIIDRWEVQAAKLGHTEPLHNKAKSCL